MVTNLQPFADKVNDFIKVTRKDDWSKFLEKHPRLHLLRENLSPKKRKRDEESGFTPREFNWYDYIEDELEFDSSDDYYITIDSATSFSEITQHFDEYEKKYYFLEDKILSTHKESLAKVLLLYVALSWQNG